MAGTAVPGRAPRLASDVRAGCQLPPSKGKAKATGPGEAPQLSNDAGCACTASAPDTHQIGQRSPVNHGHKARLERTPIRVVSTGQQVCPPEAAGDSQAQSAGRIPATRSTMKALRAFQGVSGHFSAQGQAEVRAQALPKDGSARRTQPGPPNRAPCSQPTKAKTQQPSRPPGLPTKRPP